MTFSAHSLSGQQQHHQTPARIRALNRVLPQGFGRWRLDSPQALESAARKRANTSVELSPESRIALQELLRSYRATAQLHPLGEIMTAVNLLSLLHTQLGLSAALAETPAISTRPITAPLIITGLPRTGSTLLHNLLALDEQLRAPQSWEVGYPTPHPNTAAGKTHKIRRTQQRFRLIEALNPGFRTIHELDAHLPQECLVIMASALRSHLFFSSSFVPDYQDWLDEQPQEIAYEQHRQTLQLLQGATPHRVTWALKAPSHLFSLNGLLATYPDCRIIYTKRSPEKVVGSIASLHWHLYRTFSNFVDTAELGRQLCTRWGSAQSAFDTQLASSSTLRQRTAIIDYDQLTQSPIAIIGNMYKQFGMTLNYHTRTLMQNYLQQRPQHQFGAHNYALADYGLTQHDLDKAFKNRNYPN